jgi:hypothetical protein
MFFFVLFVINNLLHLVSEKVIIVIFIIFLYFLIQFLSNLIKTEFVAKVEYILHDVNMYMNAVFNFLYINKLIYLNFRFLTKGFISVTNYFFKKISLLKTNYILKSKYNTY